MQVVDAHHHLWDLGACHYPWLMAKGVRRFFGDPTPIQKDYRVEDFRADAAAVELAASVHVQVGVAPGHELAETQWLSACAADRGLPSAIVAYCDLAHPDAGRALQAQAAHTQVRGIRQILGRSPGEDALTGSGALSADPAWREHLALLPEFGLSFDLQLVPEQMPAAAALFGRLPGLSVALCHCGSPWDQSGRGLAHWRDGLERLAALPQISVKLSGFGMFDANWTAASVRPIVETCIELFGIERCMFGSNFPVDKLYADYATVWRRYDELTRAYGTAAQTALYGTTARRFYRIDPLDSAAANRR